MITSTVRKALACACLALGTVLALSSAQARTPQQDDEARAAAIFEEVADNAAMLRVFLQAMPKGGDLHNHLAGTPSAEDYLGWAARDGYCADRATLALLAPPCAQADRLDAIATDAPFLYARLVDHLSTRGWQHGIGAGAVSGHTQFFVAFERFGAVAMNNTVPSMALALRTAAGDHVSYLELMHNPGAMTRYVLAGSDAPLDEDGLAALYAEEIAGLAPVLSDARRELDADEAAARRALECSTRHAERACAVTLRYLASGFRALPARQVFRSLLFGFALADADPRYLGVNIVQPEDWPVALRDYDLHMAMFRFLEARYPSVRRTLHAGELAFGLVPPAEMKNHMAKALDAGAERIGHGTAIAYEADAAKTLARMAREGVAVEVNLTSNAVILGVSGEEHPLQLYRRFGVPLVLSTDDQGLLRTDMTGEYVRAVREQGLGYGDLKNLARASLEYAFIPGESYWAGRALGTPVATCAAGQADAACRALLDTSEKARLQAALEASFAQFEAGLKP